MRIFCVSLAVVGEISSRLPDQNISTQGSTASPDPQKVVGECCWIPEKTGRSVETSRFIVHPIQTTAVTMKMHHGLCSTSWPDCKSSQPLSWLKKARSFDSATGFLRLLKYFEPRQQGGCRGISTACLKQKVPVGNCGDTA